MATWQVGLRLALEREDCCGRGEIPGHPCPPRFAIDLLTIHLAAKKSVCWGGGVGGLTYFLLMYFPTVNQFGRLREDHEALLTFEGDNNVILLQTAKYLLSFFEGKTAGGCGLTVGGCGLLAGDYRCGVKSGE